MIKLSRPLVVIDLEATSVHPKSARIIQVSAKRLVPSDNGTPMNSQNHLTRLVDPDTKIPKEVQELTGITQDQVERDGEYWEQVAYELSPIIKDADLMGYNIVGYDYPLLHKEYQRIHEDIPGPDERKLIDPYHLEKKLTPRTLENVYRRYTGEELEGAHNAETDVNACWHVLMGQMQNEGMKVMSPEEIVDKQRGPFLDEGRKLKRNDDGEIVLCFGKHEGKTLGEVRKNHSGYVDWMRRKMPELQRHL